jgi:hypothetical protein
VDLLNFRAVGYDGQVEVEWQTAQEIDNLGFNVYRGEREVGPFLKLNEELIPGMIYSPVGREYVYEDTDVTRGEIYYYRLEAIDREGSSTFHGPVCVDWDGDGMPDDWELEYGLDPDSDDAALDPDGDDLTNLEEYLSGTDPLNPDTDGDGILDGDEPGQSQEVAATQNTTSSGGGGGCFLSYGSYGFSR